MTANLISSISIDGLLAARDAAQNAMLECKRVLDEAAARLKVFDVDIPKVEMIFPGGEGRNIRDPEYRDRFRREIDRHVWLQLFRLTNVDQVMDSKTRSKLHATLHESQAYARFGEQKQELPELTADNIRSTFQGVFAKQQDYFEDAVEAVYRSLCWDYKTNTPGLIGEKLIIGHAFSVWGSREFQGSTASITCHTALQDLERVLCVLDKQPLPTYDFGVNTMRAVPFGEWATVPSATRPLLEVKVFRKGSAHVRIVDREHVQTMNAIIAKRYPNAVGTGSRRKQRRAS